MKEEKEILEEQKINHSWIGYRFNNVPRARLIYVNLMDRAEVYALPHQATNVILVNSPGGREGWDCCWNRYNKLCEKYPETWWKLRDVAFKALNERLTKTNSSTYGEHLDLSR